MQCPHCNIEINEDWGYNGSMTDNVGYDEYEGRRSRRTTETTFLHMICPNEQCERLIVKGETRRTSWGMGVPRHELLDSWLVMPRQTTRRIDPLIPELYASDYRQAAAILDDSPKASAALSRLVLADLLKDTGGYDAFNLSKRIEDFIRDRSNPRPLRETLHYLREIANFSVHTQKDLVTGELVEVTHEEAEWCLEVLDRLFDYYIVSPKYDEERRLAFDENLSQAGRDAIKPLPEDENP